MTSRARRAPPPFASPRELLDRIIFVAFCEDRGLLPEKCIERRTKPCRRSAR